MIEIPLTQGYVTLVDDMDIDLADFKWSACLIGKDPTTPYATRKINKQTIYMHRVILERILGRPLEKGELCDHIDMNKANNMRDNLRVCTASQNIYNTGLRVNNTTGYIGVSWVKRRQKYEAYVGSGKQCFRLGYFDDASEAAKARDIRAIELHGEFASLNFDRSNYEE